jgi:4-amino-4-deoxy-L-arabinose transferase-like glycosyltransferase
MSFHYFTDKQINPLYVSIIFLVASILFFNSGKTRISLALLFLGSLILGFFIANLDPFLILWDEQFHALVAKNLTLNPFKPVLYSDPLLEYNYKNWTSNYIWVHKQPLFLWQIALSLKLFGFNALAVRVPSIILHAVASILIYRIGKISTNERIGFYGALFFTLAYYPLELVSGRITTDHNDLSFLFYITASIWAWFEYQHTQNKYFLVLIGLFSGCAVLVKWLVGLLIYAIWFFTIGINNRQNWLKLKSYSSILSSLMITILVFVPWQVYILTNFPLEAGNEFNYNTKHFFEVIEGHGGNIWFHFNALKELYGSGVAIPYIYLLALVIFLKKINIKVYRYAILLAIVITYLFYSIAATKMTSFCIIVSPLFFLGLGSLIDTTLTFLSSKIRYTKFDLLFRPIILVLICSFLINITKIQNYHTDWKPYDNQNRHLDYNEMEFIQLLKHTLGEEKYVVFNVNVRMYGSIPIMFYTNYIAYDIIPSEKEIKEIESKKYKIAILDDNNLPDYIKNKNEILKIKFH